MGFESSTGLGVLNHYGVRTVNSSFGGVQDDEVVKFISIEFGAPTTTTSTDAAFGKTGLQAATWNKTGLDVVIPAGSIFLKADIIVETAFDALTALVAGPYTWNTTTLATTAVTANGLITATESALVNIDAVGDRVAGAGSHLTTGTAGVGATTAPTVIRILYTGTVPTVGKARLLISYAVAAA